MDTKVDKELDRATVFRVFRRAVRRLSSRWCLFLFMLLTIPGIFSPVYAQADAAALITFSQQQDIPDPPTFAQLAFRIAIATDTLVQARVGDSLQVQVAEDHFPLLQVVEASGFINGDQVLRANGHDLGGYYSLVLTLGDRSLYGHLSSTNGNYQIIATPAEDGFVGWLYKPKGLANGNAAFQNDYVIPDINRDPVERREVITAPSSLPLTLSEAPGFGSNNYAASQAAINGSNFVISQQFSRSSVQVDQTVEAQLIFQNISDETHYGLAVDIYFVLEDSHLNLAPPNCRTQITLSSQQVLHCELGNFAAGEKKSLLYSVLATEASKPHIISTAIIGNLRSDAYINVVDDVRTDTDVDGISDFNEILLGTDPTDPESVDHANVTIDVMAFYTQGAVDLYPHGVETRINQLISVANQVYADSGVGITLRPVYHGVVDYNDDDDMDTALSDIIDKTDPAFDQVDSLRETYGGDLVILFRPLGDDNSKCGLATVGGLNTQGDFSSAVEKDYAYSTIGIDCPVDLVVAHELGHNMGLTHSHLEDGTGGTFNFSTGYGVDSTFVTVMAYPAAFNTDLRVAIFSNPLIDCFDYACGIEAENEFGADATQSLNIVKYQIADYFPSRVPELSARMSASINGEETNATIAIAASIDNGLSYVQSITPTNVTDITADIYVDSKHIGLEGYFHLLIGFGSAGFLQLDALGNYSNWDGTVGGLHLYDEPRTLRTLEHFKLLDDYRVDESMIGEQLSIYMAYEVPSTGELIYTIEPLLINVVSDSLLPTDLPAASISTLSESAE